MIIILDDGSESTMEEYIKSGKTCEFSYPGPLTELSIHLTRLQDKRIIEKILKDLNENRL